MSHFEQGNRTSTPIEEQRARLKALQAEQASTLETSGIAAKAWAVRGSVPEGVKDATSLSVAVTSGKDLDRNPFERLSIKFTTSADPRYPGQSVFSYITVAERYDGTDTALPADGFSEEDVSVVTGLLDPVREGQKQGTLSEVTADLADVADPREQSVFL